MIDLIEEGEEESGMDFLELLIKGGKDALKFINSIFYFKEGNKFYIS